MTTATNPQTALAQMPQYYQRSYQLLVKFPPNENGEQTVLTVTDDSFEPEALRMTFDVYTPGWNMYWYADIVIYNLDQATTDQILGSNTFGPSGFQQGMEVVLKAGYRNNADVIWDGYVLQPLFDRDNVVDFKITLHCVLGLDPFTRNFINKSYAAGVTQQQLVQRMADDAFRKIAIDSVSPSVGTAPLSRGETVFGSPAEHFEDIAEGNNLNMWLGSKGLNLANIGSAAEVDTSDVLVFTPDTAIVGTPQQTQYGVNVRLLLDPRVQVAKPFKQIKIDNAVIRKQKIQIGLDAGLPGILDQDGLYIVLATRYIGDTRGDDWYVDVTGITSLNGKAALLQIIGTDVSQ